MKKTILRSSLWGVLTLSLFYSCRTDSATTEQTIASKEKIAAFERFEKENNIIKPIASNDQNTSSAKYVSYSYPFAQIIYNFLQAHPDYAKQVENRIGVIRLDAVSQTFGNTEKSVIFPVTNNEGKVVALWAGIINDNRDYVDFYFPDNDLKEVIIAKAAFQSYYDKKEGKLTNQAIASIKGINPIAGVMPNKQEPPVKNIQEVVMTVPNPDVEIPWWIGGGGSSGYGSTQAGGMSGGSTTHGGGSATGTPNANQEIINNLKDYPCAQKLLEQLPDLNNSLAKLIKETFGENNKDIKVIFHSEIFKSPQDNGLTTTIIENGNLLGFDVALNQDILKTATQEYVLATMYHEFIHAYLGYEFKKLGPDAYSAKYPHLENYVVNGITKFRFKEGDHQAFTPFVSMISDAIMSYARVNNPNFPQKVANALAMKGLITEKDINAVLPDAADLYNQNERYSEKSAQGVKCTKP
jgi:hypothetical protein